MRVAPRPSIAGLVLVFAAACSDSTGVSPGLTADEERALSQQMGAFMGSGLAGSEGVMSAAAAKSVPAPFSFAIDVQVPCPRGGSTRVVATINGQVERSTHTILADAAGSNRPSDCGFDVHGTTVYVTGELTSRAHVDVVNGTPVRENWASLEGAFRWKASDGREGSCDVSYTARANYTTNVATVNGRFCNSTIAFTGPIDS